MACQNLLDGDGEAIISKAVELAKRGDGLALRLCIERLVPRRERTVELELPSIRKAEDIAAAAGVVIDEAAAGRLTLAEAREFLGLLELQRKALETSELAVRLEMLEGGLGGRDDEGGGL